MVFLSGSTTVTPAVHERRGLIIIAIIIETAPYNNYCNNYNYIIITSAFKDNYCAYLPINYRSQDVGLISLYTIITIYIYIQ